MHWTEKIVLLLSPENAAKHLKNIGKIYTSPFQVYRDITSNRDESLNYTILNIYYYLVFLFIIAGNVSNVVKAFLLDAIITIIPFLFFLLPFVICNRLNYHKIREDKLFRILIIIKIQILPIFLLFLLAAKELENQTLYNISENSIWLVWLSWIVLPPLVFTQLIKSKLIWIVLNYLAFILFLGISGFTISKFQTSETKQNPILNITPNFEYLDFLTKYNYTPERLIDTLLLAIVEPIDSIQYGVTRTQFVSYEVYLSVSKRKLNTIRENLLLLDSLQSELDSSFVSRKDSLTNFIKYNENEIVTISLLDSLRAETNKRFYSDLDLVKAYRDSSKFSRNKKYFNALHAYLDKYNQTYTNVELIKQIINKNKIDQVIKIDDNKLLVLHKIPNYAYEPERTVYKESQEVFEKDFKSGSIVMRILTFPLECNYSLTE